MHKVLPLLLTLIIVAGCGNSGTSSESDSGSTESTDPLLDRAERAQAGTATIGIGDVESQMRIEMILSETSLSPQIRQNVVTAKTEAVAMSTLDIRKPYPEEVNLFVSCRSVANFPGHAVKAKVTIYVDDQPVEDFSFVYGREGKSERNNYTFNVMKHINPMATSALVRAEGRLTLYLNTDETTVTTDHPEDTAVASAIRGSNPVRINFN